VSPEAIAVAKAVTTVILLVWLAFGIRSSYRANKRSSGQEGAS